jgi:hypothetical protein
MPALQPSTLSPFVSTVQHHIFRKLQPSKRDQQSSAHFNLLSTQSSPAKAYHFFNTGSSLSCNKVRKPDTACTTTPLVFFCRENEHRGKLMLICLAFRLFSALHTITVFLSSFLAVAHLSVFLISLRLHHHGKLGKSSILISQRLG